MNRIDRQELWQRLERRERLTLVEALPEPYYRKAHLPGAVNIPHTRVDELATQLLPDKEAEIVVYCANLACENSEIAARRLTELGYRHVHDYAGGKQDWITAGLPTERGRGAPVETPSGPVADATVVACSLDEGGLAARSASVRRELFAHAVERQEIESGYAFRFPGNDDWHTKIGEFVATERRCCSFFRIAVEFEPGLGPIWLRLTGPAGTGRFIEDTFEVGHTQV